MLAIAAPSFDRPSETFIRNHVRTIAPGKTVLIAQDGTGAEHLDCPMLANIDPWSPPRSISERAANAVRENWRTYFGPTLRHLDLRKVVAFLKSHKVTAVLAEYGPMGWSMMDACRATGIPLYVYFHGYDANILPHRRAIRVKYRQLFRFAERIIAASEFMKARLCELGCEPEKIVQVPCGVDTGNFYRVSYPENGPVLMVSRLVPQKGPVLALRSFAKVLVRQPRVNLEVIGDGPLRTELEAEAALLGISERVRFHGAKDHEFVRERLVSASLFVQHCVTLPQQGVESFGLSIVEAMACGLPVVATRHGAIPEIVKHGVTGFLVAEHDVDGMAGAMATLLGNTSRAAAMGIAGRSRVVDRYTLERAASDLRGVIGFGDSHLGVIERGTGSKLTDSCERH